MKKISIYLFFLFFLTDKAFASKTFVRTKCVVFKKYNYWKNHDTGIIEKDYLGLCDQGLFGFISYPAAWLIIISGFLVLIIRLMKGKTPEEIKKEKKAEEKAKKEEAKQIDKEEISSDLGASLKRLKKMYNDGHLSKAEFEKAKNKLLK